MEIIMTVFILILTRIILVFVSVSFLNLLKFSNFQRALSKPYQFALHPNAAYFIILFCLTPDDFTC